MGYTKQIKKHSLYKIRLSISTRLVYHFTRHSHFHENQIKKEDKYSSKISKYPM